MKFRGLSNALLAAGLLAASTGVRAQVEELILATSLFDRPPVPVVVLRVGAQYHIPHSQAAALGLVSAPPLEVAELSEPVIPGLVVREVGEDTLVAEVPLAYFKPQLFDLAPSLDTSTLPPVPAAWLNYDIFYQPVAGWRPLGGTLSAAGGYNGWALESLWQFNRDLKAPALTRAATTLRTRYDGQEWSMGDVPVAQGIPLLSNRQALGLQLRSAGSTQAQAPELLLKGDAPSKGVITVLANQQQLYRAVATAGTYEVRGLPALPGEARYTVYFDDGQSVRLVDSFETSSAITLLPEGNYEYRLSAGLPRLRDKTLARMSYENTALVEAEFTYGLSRYHNVASQAYLTKGEQWLGGSLKSEWSPSLHSEVELFTVRSPGNSGALSTVSAHYGRTDFRLGASSSQYSNALGTPKDGFLSEQRVFAGYRGVNAYLLRSAYIEAGRTNRYQTYGLNTSVSLNRASVTLNASQTVRDGRREDPYFAVMFTWEFSRGKAVSTTLTQNKVNAEASYFSKDWGGSVQLDSGNGATNAGASGFYNSSVGTLFAAVGRSGTASTVGLSGGAVLYKVDSGLRFQPTASQQGDSLLVVDAGAPGAQLLVESQRKFVTGPSGHVAVPFNSRVPQRVELDIKSLSDAVFAEEVRHLVQTKPFEALLLKFDTRPMGFAVTLRMPDGSYVPEGSVVHLPDAPTLVAGDGLVWLPGPTAGLRVQTGKRTFCTVAQVQAEGEHVCH